MNKKFSKVFALALVLIMCMALAVPTFANPASEGSSSSITISKNLIMNSDATVPAAEFKFTLAPYAGSNSYPLYNGVMAGIQVGDEAYTDGITVKFTGEEATTEGLPTDVTPGATAGQKYATETFTIDFAGVNFTEEGVYRYVITEDSVSSPYAINSTNPQYIDVYVEHAQQADGSFADDLTIQGVFMHTDDTDITDPAVTPSKSSSFNNMYTTFNLKVEMNVSGNQADKNDYFKFTVEVDCPVDDTYILDNGSNLTVEGGKGKVEFQLKNGESAQINGLPVGTKYTVTDDNGTYTATYVVTENTIVKVTDGTGNVYKNTEGIAGDTTVTFTNTRGGVIPTGIILTIAPFAALMLLGVAGIVVISRKKSKAV